MRDHLHTYIFLGIFRPNQNVKIEKVKGEGKSKLSAYTQTTHIKLLRAHGRRNHVTRPRRVQRGTVRQTVSNNS